MAVKMLTFPTREEWLKARYRTIGGSDAAALVGMNPWKNNVELYNEFVPMLGIPDEKSNPAIEYGREAEKYLRGLFALDYPGFSVVYDENSMFVNDEFQFAHASLDGRLFDRETGNFGILEIKTTTIKTAAQRKKWEGKIPDNYYCQLLWYFGVTNADFAMLRAQLKTTYPETRTEIRDYTLNRIDVQDDVDILMAMGAKFWECVMQRRVPALILPEVL